MIIEIRHIAWYDLSLIINIFKSTLINCGLFLATFSMRNAYLYNLYDVLCCTLKQ